ncbi:hypothetical protein AC249_AIPGENE26100 [Exaiptasia diaphana]|nr:hypothetical protein AC249_AIPGENE26100 [Exaiptasia diaphana]
MFFDGVVIKRRVLLDASCGQMTLLSTNLREQKRLEGHIKELHSSTRFRMNKIDREIMALKKQLEENRKVYGTHCDISRQKDKNEAQLKITKVTATPSSLQSVRPSTKVRPGRRHSIASPMEMKLDYSGLERGITTNFIDENVYYGKDNKNTQRARLSAFSNSTEKLRQASIGTPQGLATPNIPSTKNIKQQRRHSIASPTNQEMTLLDYKPEISMNSPIVAFSGKDKNIEVDPVTLDRSAGYFSVTRKKYPRFSSSFAGKRLQSQGPQNNKAAPQNSETRGFARRTNYTLVFSDSEHVDDKCKKARHFSQATAEKPFTNLNDVPSKKTLFQRRRSLPNAVLRTNKCNVSAFKTSNKTEKLTAKLPTRVASARTLQPQQRQNRRPTPVEENTESEEKNNESEHKSKSESKKGNKSNDEDKSKDDDEVECFSEDEATEPHELRMLPKITLEEKIEKYFAGTDENANSVIPGHFQEVLEQFKTNEENEKNIEHCSSEKN